METPLIILTFTNEEPTDARYLRSLKVERGKLEDSLEIAEKNQLCEFKIYQDRPLSKILLELGKEEIRRRLVIFHYAGHADSLKGYMTDENYQTRSVELTKLSTFFKDCPNLRLIFLNGCCSIDQAEYFLKEGIPIVIGTDRNIADRIATEFAKTFYDQLQQNNINTAFQYARAQMRLQYDAQPKAYYREHFRGQGIDTSDNLPFSIRYRQDLQESGRWSLMEAANQPLFGLPAIPDDPTYNWPPVPYDYLKPYTEVSARIFRGRGKEISQLYRAITNPLVRSDAIITISGQSGVGKSSLLQAGLLPRLQTVASVYYFRWQADVTFPTQFLKALGANEEPLRTTWLEKEASENRPLIVIFDQVDELFNSSAPKDQQAEWPHLLRMMQQVMSVPEAPPKGRFVLSYRTEVHQRIVEDLRTFGLNSNDHFIRRLDRNGIVEIVHGLDREQDKEIADAYNLSVAPGLGEDIASYLLRDTHSPVAPVLQIILTRLWRASSTELGRQFTREAFEQLTEKGVWLSHFYQQQLETIKKQEAGYPLPVESSGLVLDILNRHTTDRSTARIQARKEVVATYNHLDAALIQRLLSDLEQLSLLAFKGNNSTLAHDTLGPIIKEAFEQSTRAGQNATRVLKSKGIEYQLRPKDALLEEPALDIVLAGKEGMRAWTKDEKMLIEKSLERLDVLQAQTRQRARAKRIRWVVGIVGLIIMGLLIFIMAHLFIDQSADKKFKEAKLEAGDDATAALQKMQAIYSENELNAEYQSDIYEVYRDHLIYKTLYEPKDSSAVNKTAFSSNGTYFALTTAQNNDVYLFDIDKKEEGPIHTFTRTSSPVTDLTFDENGNLYIASQDRRGYLWRPFGSSDAVTYAPQAGRDSTYLTRILPTVYSDSCFTLHNDGKVYIWSKNKGNWLDELPVSDAGSAISYLKNPATGREGVWVGTNTGVVAGFTASATPVFQLPIIGNTEITTLDGSRDGQHLCVGTDNGDLSYWSWQSGQWRLVRSFPSQTVPVKHLLMGPNQQWVAAIYADGQELIWDLQRSGQTPLHKLDGQQTTVHSLGYHPTDQTLLTADETGQIRAWKIPYPNPSVMASLSSFSVMNLSFATEQELYAIDKNSLLGRINLPKAKVDTVKEFKRFLGIPPEFNESSTRVLVPTDTKAPTSFRIDSDQVDRSLPFPGPVDLMTLSASFGAAVADTMLYVWELDENLRWQSTIQASVDLMISRDENLLVLATDSGQVSWYDLATGQLQEQHNYETAVKSLFPWGKDQVLLLDFKGDLHQLNLNGEASLLKGGSLIAVARDAELYIALEGNALHLYTGLGYLLESFNLPPGEEIECIALSPGGQWIAAGTNDGKIAVWRTTKGLLPLGLTETGN